MDDRLEDLQARASAVVDGGDMDCGGGLLLLLTRQMRHIDPGAGLLVRTQDGSVPADLVDWSRLAGHTVVGRTPRGADGAWHVLVERAGAAVLAPATGPGFSTAEATPIGHRLWLYSNFQCNLACGYCCAQSSPRTAAREMPVALATDLAAQFVGLGGREVFVTGGEPFLHPQIGELVGAVGAQVPTTVLTNAMVFDRGRRLDALTSMDRERVALQISLDSAGATLHDRNRGEGSHAKAVHGIELARELGFVVRIAATVYDDDVAEMSALTALLDQWEIPEEHRLIRPVARQGFAEHGTPVTIDTLEPEPTVAVDGVWWHPVAVTDPAMLVAEEPLPLGAALDTMRDAVSVQDAARREGRRHVFRCA